MFEEEQAVFLMQGKRPLGSSKLGVTEAETKSYLPACQGVFFNSLFPMERPPRVTHPENGYKTILTDVDPHVLFANCEVALELFTRLFPQPWCSITDEESCFLSAVLSLELPLGFCTLATLPSNRPAVIDCSLLRHCAESSAHRRYALFLVRCCLSSVPRYPVVGDEVKRRENILVFLDHNSQHTVITSLYFPTVPQFYRKRPPGGL